MSDLGDAGDRYDHDEVEKINALNLKWSFGLNFTINNGVHNLSNDNRSEIFYASGHTGVIYDYKANTQRLLQGHCNKITCTAYCPQEDILVTADHGPDSMLVVWDIKTGIPRKTIFDPHPHGVESLDITPDGKYIISVSKEPNDKILQTFTLWDWRNEGSAYLISSEIHPEAECYQHAVLFNPENPYEFVSTGKQRVVFWQWDPKKRDGFEFYGPSFRDPSFNFTQTVFIPKDSTQAVTGTSDGQLVVWDISLIMENYAQPEERRKIKIVNLMKITDKGEAQPKKVSPEISILKIQGDHLVVGASNGSVRFYDFQYRIIAWFEDLGIARITSISFSQESQFKNDSIKNVEEPTTQSSTKPFQSPDFIVVDMECTVSYLVSSLFHEIDETKRKRTIIMKLLNSSIITIAVRPESSTMALSCQNGHVYEWNFSDRKCVLDKPFRTFDKESCPTCLEYSPNGKFLAVATKNGAIHFYEVDKQEWQQTVQLVSISQEHDHAPEITKIVFANDSRHLAAVDTLYCVSLFRIDHKFNDPSQPREWVFAGKVKIHLAKIKDISFGESLTDKGETRLRLFSIGEDKRLVEYDVHESNQDELKMVSIFQIEQETNPSACIWYPLNKFKEDCLLTVNEEYKIKLWNVSNEDIISKRTCLGPTYGGPINKFLVLDGSHDEDKYLAYSTAEKVVGLIKLPVDGNPNRSMGLIAHPSKITGIGLSSDGKYLLTGGGDDYCVNMWLIDLATIDQNLLFKSNTDEIFPDLLEGGKEGQIYADLKDFFYYSQIRSKDENTTKARKLDGKVPLEEIPNLMRALGYYPTQKEIENMQAEVKYSSFLETGEYIEECNLETFVRLFVNHRPVYGIGKQNIDNALNVLTEGQGMTKGKISKDELIHILKNEGEKMTDEEIEACLLTLIGDGDYENALPDQIDIDILAKEILGFEEMGESQNIDEIQQ